MVARQLFSNAVDRLNEKFETPERSPFSPHKSKVTDSDLKAVWIATYSQTISIKNSKVQAVENADKAVNAFIERFSK